MIISRELVAHSDGTAPECNASLIRVKLFLWFGTTSEEEVAVFPFEKKRKTHKNIKFYDYDYEI